MPGLHGDASGRAALPARPGQQQEAIGCYQHAADLYAKQGNRFRQAGTLANLGEVRRAASELGAAGAVWRQALTILDELDHPDADHVRAKLGARTDQRRALSVGGTVDPRVTARGS